MAPLNIHGMHPVQKKAFRAGEKHRSERILAPETFLTNSLEHVLSLKAAIPMPARPAAAFVWMCFQAASVGKHALRRLHHRKDRLRQMP
ncbi:hypothetical protein IWX87_001069 [Polaromonas sp. CG_9.7]|uniref:hypothetical protein n=1 Tax=Polaromonas sp. CG_9.7 TaxID=2787732 RepID=UPI0018C92260|nr:hypothetical protein [Polaromonas sp. CG_9.7]MBG6071316.1 hypothetical protein [Polaromonas sp. CG_9.7]MBG6113317.1 hypothetical protein [Polaromonas sp. CG_9.2]MDH6183228.1 hypothetical protein [Polaromonas sp. CG_23.6]